MPSRGVCGRALNPQGVREDRLGIATAANRTREIRLSGMRGGLAETWAMVWAKRARTAETPKQPSLGLRLRASHFYPTAISQQGLTATCQDPLTEAMTIGSGRDLVWRMSPYER